MEDTSIHFKSHEFENILSCPLCSSNNQVQVGQLSNLVLLNKKTIIVDLEDYSLKRCKSCGLFFRNYITNHETELKLQNYWKNEKEDFHRWGPPSIKGLLKLKDYIYKFSYKVFNDVKLSMLDIGIGEGEFIKLFYGDYKTYGIEINPIKEVNYNKIINREILFDNIEETINEKYKSSFHIITALDIFEHLSKPNDAIKILHSMLHSNGLLVIETGNISSLPSKLMGYYKWWYVSVLEHKIFWDVKTITSFLESNNFRLLMIKKKIHKGGISFNPIPFIKFIIHLISPKLYQIIMNYFDKDITKPAFPKIPWRDHIFIVAQKL